ncbi:MAG: XrtA system polysaccharide deacetylase [Acidobacteriota bacterium]
MSKIQPHNGMKNGPITNALTIDFEDWYQGLEIPYKDWGGFEDRIVGVGHRLLQLLDDAKVKGTFFVLGYIAEQHPEIIREIANAGHEIGTHGFSHALIYQQTPELFREELTRAVGNLRELTGQPVLGHRAPFFSITKQSLWALDILSELGIRYDSSIFPVVNYRYGIPDAPRWPYEIKSNGRTLTEFPVSTWQVWGKNVPIAGGAYFRIYPYAVSKRGLSSINREGRPFAFYLHPWEIDPGHPRIKVPRRVAGLTHYFNLGATERRLRRLLRDFKFGPMREVLNVTG